MFFVYTFIGEPVSTLACEHNITMLQFTTVFNDGALQTKLIYGTSKGKLLQISYDQQNGLSEPISMDSRLEQTWLWDSLLTGNIGSKISSNGKIAKEFIPRIFIPREFAIP